MPSHFIDTTMEGIFHCILIWSQFTSTCPSVHSLHAFMNNHISQPTHDKKPIYKSTALSLRTATTTFTYVLRAGYACDKLKRCDCSFKKRWRRHHFTASSRSSWRELVLCDCGFWTGGKGNSLPFACSLVGVLFFFGMWVPPSEWSLLRYCNYVYD